MSILDRLSRLIRANVNDMISKAEDPSKIIEQSLLDMRNAYAQARSEVADSMAQQSKLQREADTNTKLATEYQSKAEEALKLGNEDLAREALRRKKNSQDLAAGFQAQLSQQGAMVDQLKTQLRALEAKIDEMESKKELLQARQSTASASQTMEKMSGFDKSAGAMSAFEDMERKVSGMEDKAQAMRDLRTDNDLDTQLSNLGRDKAIDDDLAALKAKVQGQSQASAPSSSSDNQSS